MQNVLKKKKSWGVLEFESIFLVGTMVKGLSVSKIVKNSSLKGPGATYKQKQFAVTIIHKIFKKNSSFHVK